MIDLAAPWWSWPVDPEDPSPRIRRATVVFSLILLQITMQHEHRCAWHPVCGRNWKATCPILYISIFILHNIFIVHDILVGFIRYLTKISYMQDIICYILLTYKTSCKLANQDILLRYELPIDLAIPRPRQWQCHKQTMQTKAKQMRKFATTMPQRFSRYKGPGCYLNCVVTWISGCYLKT